MLAPLIRTIQKLQARRDPDYHLLKKVRPYTFIAPVSLKTIKRLAMLVNSQGIEGDFVECGTYKGGSAAVLATALTDQRHLWLYDSFEGLPEANQIDGELAKTQTGECLASEEDVIQALTTVGVPATKYTIRKGWFEQTFKQPLPRQVALLHCDADWYDSVLIVLETFYPLITPGGCIIMDDFGYWEGCREAFYDFCFKHGEKPLLERVGSTQAYWIKEKTSNRRQS